MVKKDEAVEKMVDQILSGQLESNFLGLSSARLENVASYDFTEYIYILEPEILLEEPVPPPQPPPTQIPQPTPTPTPQPTPTPTPEPALSDSEIDRLYESSFDDRIGYWTHRAKGGAPWTFPGWFMPAWDLPNVHVRIWYCLVNETTSGAYEKLTELFRLITEIEVTTDEFFDIIFERFFYKNVNGRPYEYVYDVGRNVVSDDRIKNRWTRVADFIGLNYSSQWQAAYDELHPPPVPPPPPEVIQFPDVPILPTPKETTKLPTGYSFDIHQPNSWNFGLRLVYRQEWRSLGNQRGEVIRTIPLGPKQVEKVSTKIIRRKKTVKTSENLKSVEQTSEISDTSKDSSEIVNEASETQSWHVEAEASVNVGFVSGSISGGMEGETEKRTNDTTSRLSEVMQKTANKIRRETKTVVSLESETTYEVTTSSEISNPNEEIPITYVYSKLQRQYEIFTSLAEVQNVIMIAEDIPFSYKIDFNWVKKYDWILAKVLLDDSFRDALTAISQEPILEDAGGLVNKIDEKLSQIQLFFKQFADKLTNISLGSTDIVQESQKNYRDLLTMYYERSKLEMFMEHKRQRLYQHIRDNILYYYRAIWTQEDPQQRILRYQKLNVQIPGNWYFVNNLDDKTIDLNDLYVQLKNAETDEDEETVFELDGYFVYDDDPETFVNIVNLINPAGPIGFYGNYAIYYIKPEYTTLDIFKMLDILKMPYLYYESADSSPILMDPMFKRLTNEVNAKDNIELTNSVKEEMIEIILELRVACDETLKDGQDALDDFLKDDDLFLEYYAEYLFRKERSRKFLLDTHNVILDIEPGTGTALEPFKLAHRAVDVLKALEEKWSAELDNKRKEELLKQGKLHSKFWPGVEKVVVFEEAKGTYIGRNETTPSSNSNETGVVNYPVKKVKILRKLIARLEELGIESTLELLEKCDTLAERRKIIRLLELTQTELKEIIDIIDLMRIRGISEDEAKLFNAIGINSVKELARRNSKNLFKVLKNYAKEHGKKVPEEEEVAKWIERAKKFV